MEFSFPTLLRRAHQAQFSAIRHRLPGIGLSPGQPKVLDFLSVHDGCIQRDLAELCGIEPATVSRLLDKMEAEGLILRRPSPGCKRSVQIWLTDLGRERRQAFAAIQDQVCGLELEGFTPAEREQFAGFLVRLHRNLTSLQKEAAAHE